MNFYKLIKSLRAIIDEQEELLNIGEVQLMNGFSGRGWWKDVAQSRAILKVLSPIKKELENSLNKNLFEQVYPTSYMELSNNRCCIFKGKSGRIYCAFYTERAASCFKNVTNDHYALYSHLERVAWEENDDELITTKRWCGFYSFVCNNKETMLILHGMSDTFPHNEFSSEILREAVKQNFGNLDQWHTPDKVIFIGDTIETLR